MILQKFGQQPSETIVFSGDAIKFYQPLSRNKYVIFLDIKW